MMLALVLVCDPEESFLVFSAMQVYKSIVLGKCAQPIGVNEDHELQFF